MDWNRLYSLISQYRNGKISRELFVLEWRLAQKRVFGSA
jgi:hypothetical protein